MLKILQARFQQYVNQELTAVQARFRKGRGTRDQIANICWVIKKKQGNSRKTSTSASLITLKLLTLWITTNWKVLRRDGNTRPPDLPPEKTVCRSGSNSRNWTQNNGLVPSWERSTSRLYIVTLLT